MRNLALTLLVTLSAGLSAAEGTVSGIIDSISGSDHGTIVTLTKDDASSEDFILSDTTKIMVGPNQGVKSDLRVGYKITKTSSSTGPDSVLVTFVTGNIDKISGSKVTLDVKAQKPLVLTISDKTKIMFGTEIRTKSDLYVGAPVGVQFNTTGVELIDLLFLKVTGNQKDNNKKK